MKTTCKAFKAFFKELANIEKTYSDSLLKLTKTSILKSKQELKCFIKS